MAHHFGLVLVPGMTLNGHLFTVYDIVKTIKHKPIIYPTTTTTTIYPAARYYSDLNESDHDGGEHKDVNYET